MQVAVGNDSLSSLAAGNGSSESERQVLKQLRVQLLDRFDNAAPHSSCQARVRVSEAIFIIKLNVVLDTLT